MEANKKTIEQEIDRLVGFVTDWEERVKKLKHPGTSFNHGNAHDLYLTTAYQYACQQIINDISELFFSEGRVNIDEVEKIILVNLDKYFSRLKVADLAGISIRTVRNKLNGAR